MILKELPSPGKTKEKRSGIVPRVMYYYTSCLQTTNLYTSFKFNTLSHLFIFPFPQMLYICVSVGLVY